jgi:hypothetical protein
MSKLLWDGTPMRDMTAHLEKLRTDAAECALISELSTEVNKRELFARLSRHLTVLASEVERAIALTTESEPAPMGKQADPFRGAPLFKSESDGNPSPRHTSRLLERPTDPAGREFAKPGERNARRDT